MVQTVSTTSKCRPSTYSTILLSLVFLGPFFTTLPLFSTHRIILPGFGGFPPPSQKPKPLISMSRGHSEPPIRLGVLKLPPSLAVILIRARAGLCFIPWILESRRRVSSDILPVAVSRLLNSGATDYNEVWREFVSVPPAIHGMALLPVVWLFRANPTSQTTACRARVYIMEYSP